MGDWKTITSILCSGIAVAAILFAAMVAPAQEPPAQEPTFFYGIDTVSDTLFKVNSVTGKVVMDGPLVDSATGDRVPWDFGGVAFDSAGTLYGLNSFNESTGSSGGLYSIITKTTDEATFGEATLIESTEKLNLESFTIINGVGYSVDLAKTLYSIDLMTAAASEIGRLVSDDNSNDDVTGLATDGTNLYGARLCFFTDCSEIVELDFKNVMNVGGEMIVEVTSIRTHELPFVTSLVFTVDSSGVERFWTIPAVPPFFLYSLDKNNPTAPATRVVEEEGQEQLDLLGVTALGVEQAAIPQPTPLLLKGDAITELNAVKAAIQGGAPNVGDAEEAVESLDKAIAALQASLTSFESDGIHIMVPDGKNFFNNEEDAVEEIFDAIEEGAITDANILMQLQNVVVDKILEADKIVAETAINDAIDANGNSGDIADAQAEFATAQQQVADGVAAGIIEREFFDDAVGSFEDAWENAQEAVEEEDDDDKDKDKDKDKDHDD